MNREQQRITKQLRWVGATWAVSPEKYLCTNWNCCQPLDGARPAYHIHPDRLEPHQDNVKRFTSLAAIRDWIANQEEK